MQSIDPSTYGEEQEAGTEAETTCKHRKECLTSRPAEELLSLSSENSYEQSHYLGL